MIIRFSILAVSLLSVCSGKLTPAEFSSEIEQICFKKDSEEPLINGQPKPLASTLENFIALLEKFEAANPRTGLKDEIFYFIRNFFYENILLTNQGVSRWDPPSYEKSDVDTLWEPDENKRKYDPELGEIFTDEERCSLFFMISHAIIEGPEKQQIYRSIGNHSFPNGHLRGMPKDEDLYPQEIGVVAIRGTDAAVSLSRVLMGLYVGLNENRKRNLDEFQNIKNLPKNSQITLPVERTVDPLFSLTMAEVLMLSEWKWTDRKALTPNGQWMSTTIGDGKSIAGFCPMIYKVQDGKPAFSYSSVRGAADGLILGLIAPSLKDARLSQVLRMYYSERGIAVKPEIQDDISPTFVSFCGRKRIIERLENNIATQMILYGFLTSQKFTDINETQASAIDHYKSYKPGIFDMTDSRLKNYCEIPVNPEKPEDLPVDTNLDIIIVLDSGNPENFERQQLIAGFFANKMDLRYEGSKMTILLDKKESSNTDGTTKLKVVVEDTNSSSCAACMVGQYASEDDAYMGQASKEDVVISVNKLLQERKKIDEQLNGARGKIVIFFDFDTDEPSKNNKIQGNLQRMLTQMYTEHRDVMFYCVGLNDNVMKKYAREDTSFILSVGDGGHEDVAERLYKKVSSAPGVLQYIDCHDGRSESTAVYDSFVSPNEIQHWYMPAKYFYKTFTARIIVQSQNGAVKVCYNRGTMEPELEKSNCRNTTTPNPVDFILKNPCKGLNKDTCSPFYLSVMGMSPNGNQNGNSNGIRSTQFCSDLKDRKCKTLDQIKFTVSHEGVRCSNCPGLFASAMTIFLAVLFLRLLNRF